MNVLITGGAGYVGTELIYALVNEDAVKSIVVYDNLIRANYNLFLGIKKLDSKKVSFVRADILDTRKLKNEVEKADVVFHLAAKVTTPFADHNPHEFDQINNWGTAELCYLIEQSNVSKFIYASSASVYGASAEAIELGTTPEPKTFYGISKWQGEGHVNRLLNSKTMIYILRLGNVYGYSKSMRFDSVINKFMFEANFAHRLRIFGNGEQLRPFIHVNRLCQELKNIALTKSQTGVFNLIENTFSINEIVDQLKIIYPELEMVFVNQNMAMRSLNIVPNAKFNTPKSDKNEQLLADLQDFKSNLSF